MNEHKSEQCQEFELWRKRFHRASWSFLILAVVFLFFSERLSPFFAALIAGIFWWLAESVIIARHLKWHMDNDDACEQ